jgi:hypothetical protein
MSGCVGICRCALLFPWARDAAKTALLLLLLSKKQNIDCGRVNIPNKLRHSERHVIQSSFSFSFNNQ